MASIGGAALLATLGVDILANDTSLLRSLENIARRLATLGGLFDDFLKYDEWVQRTAATFDALGQSGEKAVGAIDGVAKGMANLGVNLNDARQSVALVGREFGGSEERMRTFANMVTGLTARYNLSADAARTAAQAYLEGNTRTLEGVAGTIPELRMRMLRGFGGPGLFSVFGQGAAEGMGMQDRLANTLTATMTRLSNAFQLIRESFQRVFGPPALLAMEMVSGALQKAADQADKFFKTADFRKDWQPALVEARLALESLSTTWDTISAAAGKAFNALRDVLKTSPSAETQENWDTFLVFLHQLPDQTAQLRDALILVLDQFAYEAEDRLEKGFRKFLAWLKNEFTPEFMNSSFFKFMMVTNPAVHAVYALRGAGGGGEAPTRAPYRDDPILTRAMEDRARAMKEEGNAYREQLAERRRQLRGELTAGGLRDMAAGAANWLQPWLRFGTAAAGGGGIGAPGQPIGRAGFEGVTELWDRLANAAFEKSLPEQQLDQQKLLNDKAQAQLDALLKLPAGLQQALSSVQPQPYGGHLP